MEATLALIILTLARLVIPVALLLGIGSLIQRRHTFRR